VGSVHGSEVPDPYFWRERDGRSPLVVGMVAAVIVLAIGTAVGLILLWPNGKLGGNAKLGILRTEGAVVRDVRRVACPGPAAQACRRVTVTLSGGRPSAFTIFGQQNTLALSAGDHIRVYATGAPKGDKYSFSDFDRRSTMLWFAIGFVVLLLLSARLRGIRALLGLVASLVVVVEFVIPAILHGHAPVLVAVVGAFAVMLLTMPLAYGLGPKMIAALLGTALSLLVAAGLADAAGSLAHLSGAASDEAVYLAATQSISLRGLLVAGMVIGALGVLVDLTVSQASTVVALRRANPRLGFGGLFREALDVGHDHISATVNTLVFAYAGASLPALLIFTIGRTSFTDAINGEAVAAEVIAALVGSIGLILSMPLTTALAALLVERMNPESLSAAHAHAH
jgi:uncharacterized membrane protein